MPIEIGWHPSLPHTIYYQFINIWTWQDYGVAFEQELRMALSLGGQKYNVIGDLLDTSLIPKGHAFGYVYDTVKRSPNNMGQVALVTSNSYLRTMLTTFIKIYPRLNESLYVTNSLDDAIYYLSVNSGATSPK